MRDDDAITNPSAPPGKAARYARRELERRFLLAKMPPGEVVRTVEIHDRYLEGTRIRLRRMSESKPGGAPAVRHKLTQKLPGPDGASGLITTMYLSEEEYVRLSVVPARVLAKTRLHLPPFAVDVFTGPLEGLLLAEAECESEGELGRIVVPAWAAFEVTTDPRFTGGRLAVTTRDELAATLRSFGLER